MCLQVIEMWFVKTRTIAAAKTRTMAARFVREDRIHGGCEDRNHGASVTTQATATTCGS